MKNAAKPLPVIGYVRVSTDDQATNGHGLDAQRAAIQAEADRRGWTLEWVHDNGKSGKNLKRPGLQDALERLRRRKAAGLVVAKLDRLSRSTLDFLNLVERARKEKWTMTVLDVGIDTSTASGELMVTMLAAIAQFERKMIGQRTRAGLAAARVKGARFGNPARVAGRTPAAVHKRILALRAKGLTFAAIATELNRRKVPTAFGGRKWYASSIRSVMLRSS